MVVKRIAPKHKKSEKKKIAKKIVGRKTKSPTYELPDKPKVVRMNLLEYILLVYGREKIGKTELFASFPDALFITTEPGTKGLEIYEFLGRPVESWEEVQQCVKLLEKNKKRFKYVIIDTADCAYDMCLDYVCRTRHIEYPGQDDSGREDFGRSWKAVKSEFTDVIHRIIRTGRGVGFTSHMKETTIRSRSGETYDRIYPTMGNQARAVIEALVDLFFFADYVKGTDGRTRRILITEGDESIWAGHRKCAGKLPQFLPLEEDNGYEVIAEAFRGDHPGVDPSEIRASAQTSETSKQFIQSKKSERVVSKHKRKEKKKKVRKIRKKKARR